MQQCSKGKVKTLEPPVCNQCAECGVECELRSSKLTSCMECHEAKAKCEQPGKEKLERKHK